MIHDDSLARFYASQITDSTIPLPDRAAIIRKIRHSELGMIVENLIRRLLA